MISENQTFTVTLRHENDTIDRLCQLIMIRDRVMYHESNDVMAEFMMKFGAKEQLVWKKMLELKKAKFRLAQFRMYAGTGKQPNPEYVENLVKEQFAQDECDLK